MPGCTVGSFTFHELQRGGINAMALPGRGGPVIEDVAKMRATTVAVDFRSHHAVASIGLGSDRAVGDGVVETGPPSPGIKFRGGTIERLATADAGVGSVLLVVPVRAGKSRLRSVLACDEKLLGRQL